MGWQSMESAPKGGGAEFVTDPAYVQPPLILLKFDDGKVSVARWEEYYKTWVEPCSGDSVDQHYGDPRGWMPLPLDETTPTGPG